MEIKGKVHCFFEQSGAFKNEFIKLGIPAEDYDIQNNFGETDHVIDLFAEIEKGYNGEPSIFDNITKDDLIVAFFPCIYFTGFTNPRYFTLENNNYLNLTLQEKLEKILERAKNREIFYELIIKMVGVCLKNGIRIIIENPYSTLHYLDNNFFKQPTMIDEDRTLRGDYFKKPTAYWYFNCEPTYGESYQKDKEQKTIMQAKSATHAGLCSEERSMISTDYARNFICDFVLGKEQAHSQPQLF
ncbi:MAG: hypothetical protein II453_03445 [Alphaproteobacteria bacterium]|nr:hypothetical protein [Alphaproteobacteria bacterium]